MHIAPDNLKALQSSSDFWANAVVILLWTAALIAALIGASSYASNKASTQLMRAKDRRAAEDNRISSEKIATLTRDAETQRALVATAQATAATATRDAADANKATELEKIQRLKLEAKVAPRQLTKMQQESIGVECKLFSGSRVTVLSYAMDIEGGVLGKQILLALGAAGIETEDGTASQMPVGFFVTGIKISGPDELLVRRLKNSLHTTGALWLATEGENSGLPVAPGVMIQRATSDRHNDAVILVGVKPLPN